MTTTAQIKDLDSLKALIKEPQAILTLKSRKTSQAFTYEIRKSDEGKVTFVGVLTSKGKFAYLGTVHADGCFKHGKKSHLDSSDKRSVAFSWAWCGLFTLPAPVAQTYFQLLDVFEGAPGFGADAGSDTHVFYTCKSCDHTFVKKAKNTHHVASDTCPKCSKKLKGKKLEATFSTKGHVCNAACMYATGHVCTCSCGGANHGVGHIH
jgi:hypothetical protein